ncbi:MAG TPA: GNAT family N-acetyltransferase [Thermoleophilia bacterium]|nr:GNAT family N-acetyltransferase [Thermoleophilia bacterium]
MAVLRRSRRVTLRDGREAVVRSAVPIDTSRLRRLVDAVAAEPQTPLLLLPGQFGARDWRRRIADAAADPHALLLLAEVGGELAGNLGLHRDPHPCSAHVTTVGMSVAGGWRGLGVGSALLEVAGDWAQRHGCRRITLSVFPHNTAAIRFYEARGFAREGLRRGQFVRDGRTLDEVVMGRLLDEETFAWATPPLAE